MSLLPDFKIPPSERVKPVYAAMLRAYHPNLFITEVDELISAYPEFSVDNIINNTDPSLDWKDVLKDASPFGAKNVLSYELSILLSRIQTELIFLVTVRNVIFLCLAVLPGDRHKSLIFSLLYQMFDKDYFMNRKCRAIKRAEFIYERERNNRDSFAPSTFQSRLSDRAGNSSSTIPSSTTTAENVEAGEGDGLKKSASSGSLTDDHVKTLEAFYEQECEVALRELTIVRDEPDTVPVLPRDQVGLEDTWFEDETLAFDNGLVDAHVFSRPASPQAASTAAIVSSTSVNSVCRHDDAVKDAFEDDEIFSQYSDFALLVGKHELLRGANESQSMRKKSRTRMEAIDTR